MKDFLLKQGAILILDLICLSNLILLILSKNYQAVWPLSFVVVLNIVYFIFVYKYGSPRKEDY